jgi:hypothetical protein
MDFWPLGNNNNNRSILILGFLKDDIFWLVLKLEISYRVDIFWLVLKLEISYRVLIS